MKINVAVFMGGKSCEHEISCISAHQVIEALDKNKYEIIPIYISKENDLYSGDLLFDLVNYSDLEQLKSRLNKICIYKDNNKTYIKPIKGAFARSKPIDVSFNAVHGTNVEDGTLSGLLEMMDVPYTSSNVLGSAIGQDKAIMKEIFEYEKIPVVKWFYFYTDEIKSNIDDIKTKAKKIGYPLIIKPANLGSSIGIEIVHNEDELVDKLKEASNYDFKLVVEKMVTNLKEVNISVMGNVFEAKTSLIEEVIKNDELLSFKDKYEGGSKSNKKLKVQTSSSKGMASTNRKIPADITEKQTELINTLALKAFKALNANGVVRIDFIIDDDNDKVYVNEINSIPGSLAFYLWKDKGIDFTSLCDELIDNAIKMYREKEKKTYSFDTNILSNYGRN